MTSEPLIGLGVVGYVVFFTILAVAIGLTYWLIPIVKQKRRVAFVEQFAGEDLRVNAYKTKIVYRVLEDVDEMVTAQCVWRGKSAETDGEQIKAAAEHFAPFDRAAFLNAK